MVDARSLSRCLRRLFEMTNDLVPGDVRVENHPDPDHPETVHLVFRVAALAGPNDAQATIDMELEWHRRARAILPDATCYFRLAIE